MSAHRASKRGRASSKRVRRIALFGGTFDPIHAGHLAVAHAALRRFRLDCVYFIPCGRPPHKHRANLTAFPHRYAMVALACAGEPRFVGVLGRSRKRVGGTGNILFRGHRAALSPRSRAPRRSSLFPARRRFVSSHPRVAHSGETAHALRFHRRQQAGFSERGVAARSAEGAAGRAGRTRRSVHFASGTAAGSPATSVYLLDAVASHVSATEVRWRLDNARPIRNLVPAPVEDYIKQQGLYQR